MSAFIRPELLQFSAYSTHAPQEDTFLPEVVDQLDTNECAYDLPAALKAKLAWHYQEAIAANRYPSGSHNDVKAAIARYVNSSAMLPEAAVTSRHISVGNGSDELIRSLLIATCVGRSGAILVAAPTFSMYGILAQTLGVPVVTIGRNDETFEVDLKAAQTAVEQNPEPIRLVFMVSPNSPTGNALTSAELAWLRQLPEDVLVVVDEAYFEFSQQTTVTEALYRANWVVTRTFSKAFRLAAHRVGYAIAASTIIQVLEKVRLPYNLPSFSQAATLVALAHASELLTKIAEVQAERDRLAQAFTSLPNLKLWPSAANFLYCRPTQLTGKEVQQRLQQQGTYIRQTGGGLRITIGTPQENGRTLDHMQQIFAR
ncbi:MAG: histidinol-phosphate transaminase [Cyanobacteria bacterium P01_H01_bin.58]